MFDFFKDLEKKRAFKQALREVNEEDGLALQTKKLAAKTTSNKNIERVYHSMAKEEKTQGVQNMAKPRTNYHKPETTAVDLKNFKDWRKVGSVDSKQPRYSQANKRRSLFDDDDDDIGTSKIDFPGGNFEYKSQSDIDSTKVISSMTAKKTEAKSANDSLRELLEKAAPKQLHEADKKVDTVAAASTIATTPVYASPIKRVKAREIDEPIKPVEQKLKVEVVDFTPITKPEKVALKEEPKVKPTVEAQAKTAVKRRTRGKAKKRFDADVINSVDWK